MFDPDLQRGVLPRAGGMWNLVRLKRTFGSEGMTASSQTLRRSGVSRLAVMTRLLATSVRLFDST